MNIPTCSPAPSGPVPGSLPGVGSRLLGRAWHDDGSRPRTARISAGRVRNYPRLRPQSLLLCRNRSRGQDARAQNRSPTLGGDPESAGPALRVRRVQTLSLAW